MSMDATDNSGGPKIPKKKSNAPTWQTASPSQAEAEATEAVASDTVIECGSTSSPAEEKTTPVKPTRKGPSWKVASPDKPKAIDGIDSYPTPAPSSPSHKKALEEDELREEEDELQEEEDELREEEDELREEEDELQVEKDELAEDPPATSAKPVSTSEPSTKTKIKKTAKAKAKVAKVKSVPKVKKTAKRGPSKKGPVGDEGTGPTGSVGDSGENGGEGRGKGKEVVKGEGKGKGKAVEKPESDEDDLDTEEEVEENRSRTPLLEDRAFGNFTIAGGSGSSHEPLPITESAVETDHPGDTIPESESVSRERPHLVRTYKPRYGCDDDDEWDELDSAPMFLSQPPPAGRILDSYRDISIHEPSSISTPVSTGDQKDDGADQSGDNSTTSNDYRLAPGDTSDWMDSSENGRGGHGSDGGEDHEDVEVDQSRRLIVIHSQLDPSQISSTVLKQSRISDSSNFFEDNDSGSSPSQTKPAHPRRRRSSPPFFDNQQQADAYAARHDGDSSNAEPRSASYAYSSIHAPSIPSPWSSSFSDTSSIRRESDARYELARKAEAKENDLAMQNCSGSVGEEKKEDAMKHESMAETAPIGDFTSFFTQHPSRLSITRPAPLVPASDDEVQDESLEESIAPVNNGFVSFFTQPAHIRQVGREPIPEEPLAGSVADNRQDQVMDTLPAGTSQINTESTRSPFKEAEPCKDGGKLPLARARVEIAPTPTPELVQPPAKEPSSLGSSMLPSFTDSNATTQEKPSRSDTASLPLSNVVTRRDVNSLGSTDMFPSDIDHMSSPAQFDVASQSVPAPNPPRDELSSSGSSMFPSFINDAYRLARDHASHQPSQAGSTKEKSQNVVNQEFDFSDLTSDAPWFTNSSPSSARAVPSRCTLASSINRQPAGHQLLNRPVESTDDRNHASSYVSSEPDRDLLEEEGADGEVRAESVDLDMAEDQASTIASAAVDTASVSARSLENVEHRQLSVPSVNTTPLDGGDQGMPTSDPIKSHSTPGPTSVVNQIEVEGKDQAEKSSRVCETRTAPSAGPSSDLVGKDDHHASVLDNGIIPRHPAPPPSIPQFREIHSQDLDSLTVKQLRALGFRYIDLGPPQPATSAVIGGVVVETDPRSVSANTTIPPIVPTENDIGPVIANAKTNGRSDVMTQTTVGERTVLSSIPSLSSIKTYIGGDAAGQGRKKKKEKRKSKEMEQAAVCPENRRGAEANAVTTTVGRDPEGPSKKLKDKAAVVSVAAAKVVGQGGKTKATEGGQQKKRDSGIAGLEEDRSGPKKKVVIGTGTATATIPADGTEAERSEGEKRRRRNKKPKAKVQTVEGNGDQAKDLPANGSASTSRIASTSNTTTTTIDKENVNTAGPAVSAIPNVIHSLKSGKDSRTPNILQPTLVHPANVVRDVFGPNTPIAKMADVRAVGLDRASSGHMAMKTAHSTTPLDISDQLESNAEGQGEEQVDGKNLDPQSETVTDDGGKNLALWNEQLHPDIDYHLDALGLTYPSPELELKNLPSAQTVKSQLSSWSYKIVRSRHLGCLLGGTLTENEAMVRILELRRSMGRSFDRPYSEDELIVLSAKLDLCGRYGPDGPLPVRILSSTTIEFVGDTTNISNDLPEFAKDCLSTSHVKTWAGHFTWRGHVMIWSYRPSKGKLRIYTIGSGLNAMVQSGLWPNVVERLRNALQFLAGFKPIGNVKTQNVAKELSSGDHGPIAVSVLQHILLEEEPLDQPKLLVPAAAFISKLRRHQARLLLADHAQCLELDSRVRKPPVS